MTPKHIWIIRQINLKITPILSPSLSLPHWKNTVFFTMMARTCKIPLLQWNRHKSRLFHYMLNFLEDKTIKWRREVKFVLSKGREKHSEIPKHTTKHTKSFSAIFENSQSALILTLVNSATMCPKTATTSIQ